jgi:HSP20 family protein
MTLVKTNGKRTQHPEFSHWLDQLFDVPPSFALGHPEHRINSNQPAVNIKENDKEFLLELAAPGLKKEDFNISFEKDHLVISASKKTETEEKDESHQVRRTEFHYESFERSFLLQEDKVDVDQINAQYQDGILKLVIPKKEEEKRVKQITIA